MATLTSLQTQLASVQAAIAAAEEAQQMAIGDKQVSRANIAHLYQREAYLERRIDRMTASGTGRIPLRGATIQDG